jgi:hypothetical protein
MSKIFNLGFFHIQFDFDWTGWYYINQKNEKVNMGFFIGTVTPPEEDCKLYQFIIGPFMMTWAFSY